MKKFIIIIAAALILCACTMGDYQAESRDASALSNLNGTMYRKSVKGPADVISKSLSPEIFEEDFQDTLWSRTAELDLVVKKTPDDSCWMVFPLEDSDYNFYSFVSLLPTGIEGHNDFQIATSGSYDEKSYSAAFKTEGEFFLNWEEYGSDYNGLDFSIVARPHGQFRVETFMGSTSLDYCTQIYNGENVQYESSKSSGSIERIYY